MREPGQAGVPEKRAPGASVPVDFRGRTPTGQHLIDFGVGSYAGAPIITPHGIPPGTSEYRSPEACRFNRANTELAHKEPAARYTSVEELRVALAGALAEAELDERWDLPLFEPAVDDPGPPEAPRALPSRRPPSARRRIRPLAAAGLATGVLGASPCSPAG